MGRPQSAEKHKPVSVSLNPIVLARLDLDARRAGVTRSAWIAHLILNNETPKVVKETPVLTASLNKETPPAEKCDHPKNTLTVHSWGTMCSCGARIR